MLEDFMVSDDEDITLLTHKFKCFLHRKGSFKNLKNKEEAERKEVKKDYSNKKAQKDIKKEKSSAMEAMDVTCKMSIPPRMMTKERKFYKSP